MKHPRKEGRKATRITKPPLGSRDDWRAKLNAALTARGDGPVSMRRQVSAGFAVGKATWAAKERRKP